MKFWGWGCSLADDPAARHAQNFINKAVLWDYFYQFCSFTLLLVHSIPAYPSIWYIQQGKGSSRASLRLLSNEGESCELWHSCHERGGQAESLEEGSLILRAEGHFQGQQLLSYPLAHSTGHPPASCAVPPQPQNSREDGKPRAGHCCTGRREEEEKDGPADIPLGHQLMADADSCAPVSSPIGWGRCTERGSCSLRGYVAMSPRPGSDQNKGQPVLHQEQCLHDPSVTSSALPTLGSPMNTADIFQPCTLTIYRHRPFTSLSEVLLWPPAQRKEKLASGILEIQITIWNLASVLRIEQESSLLPQAWHPKISNCLLYRTRLALFNLDPIC